MLVSPPFEDASWGYQVSLAKVPIATENVFFNYDDSEPSVVSFELSNGDSLVLLFREAGVCYLIPKSGGRGIRSASQFKAGFPVDVAFVPILGPVEHDEPLYKQEAARLALLTHRASRNFRNIWYHYPDQFDDFRRLINETWPGMDINRPEIDTSHGNPMLRMFCPEDRIARELYWSGFGFQVWCQMLTFVMRAKQASILLIDEPDIYLHPDLQRRLLGVLKSLGPDITIATHSTEIIAEVEPEELIVISKSNTTGRRIKNPDQLSKVFQDLGSSLNPTLTQLAKTRRAIFVEGKDFQILSCFARKLGKEQVANRTDFAVLSVEGFNPQKVKDFVQGIESALGTGIQAGVIFDRDFRCDEEIQEVTEMVSHHVRFLHIHSRKEIENFLLHPHAIETAIMRRINDRNKRSESTSVFGEDVVSLLGELTSSLRHRIEAQFLDKRRPFARRTSPKSHATTIDETLLGEFERVWDDFERRLLLVPGKEVLGLLNKHINDKYHVSVTPSSIIDSFKRSEVPPEMCQLIDLLDSFRLYGSSGDR